MEHYLILANFIQEDAESFSLSEDIFFRIFGCFFKKLFDFFVDDFSKVLVCTKRFENNNSDLVLRRQKKSGFLRLVPDFSKDILDL